jgi:hypothetical protein
MGIKFTAGWTSPDFAIDFPRIFTDMRSDLSGQLTDNSIFTTIKRTVHFIATSEMTEIDIQDINITGLKFIIDGNEYRISCKNCVLATGAWTTDILSKIAINLPIIRREFLILVVKKEHFDINNIIICLDVDKEDGNGTGDVTIAPFGDSILAANADFKVVYNQKDRKIENYSWGRSELEALKCGLYQCFTKIGTLTDADYNVRLCFKTEQFNSFYPDVDLKIYTE